MTDLLSAAASALPSSSAEAGGPPPVGEVPCRECRNPIPVGARKCAKCTSFQDWRRPVFVWSGMFTAALALLPLWTGALSLWSLAVKSPARIEVLPIACRSNRLEIYARNVGQQEAILGDPKVETYDGTTWQPFDFAYVLSKEERIATPGKGNFINLSPPEEGSFPVTGTGTCRLRAVLPILGAGSGESRVEATCSCSA